ncbi:MAG: tetratricopeptide repeat protein [Bacteroidales bacterium]|jgi:tetratricopeptide (TPR) repeat protein|nr:tetratricopeptide repeat protein [Bacteroidales bacterium]
MKKILSLIIAIFLAGHAFPKNTFEQGNDFYIAEEYKKASEAYMSVVKSGFVSSELYYNLGNSFFRLGDYPNAILYYEKAKRLAPKDEEILMNLGIANTKITDRFEVMPDIFFMRWWKTFAGFFSRDQWAIVFLCLVFATVLCLAWYFLTLTYGRKKTAFYICAIFVILSGTVIGAGIQQHQEQTRRAGIIMKNKINVSSSPQTDRPKFVIHGGTKVDILDEIGNYYRIRVADGSNGWISKEELAVI